MSTIIPVYALNLKERTDRFEHIKAQFEDRPEFNLTIVDAIRHTNGAFGLWQTFISIVQSALAEDHDYVILCEDDHEFTETYSPALLFESIEQAIAHEADILSGGPSWVSSISQVTDDIFWMESFSGTQFIIIFKKFYAPVLNFPFEEGHIADGAFSALSNKKFFLYPFISRQKEFGYSDATPINNTEGRVEELFLNCSERISLSKQVRKYYTEHSSMTAADMDLERISIPTYVINLPERTDRREHIESQFSGKQEFDVTFIEAIRHEIGAVGLWMSIRKIIQLAIDNDDDVIIISEDDHEFTEDYSKEFLLHTIIDASQQGVDYLSGGCGGFGSAIPVSPNRYWVSTLLSTQFIVVYRGIFRAILDEPFDDEVKADLLLSRLTANKMLMFPFISVQKDFGYSDVTPLHDATQGLITNLFDDSKRRLTRIQSFHLSQLEAS